MQRVLAFVAVLAIGLLTVGSSAERSSNARAATRAPVVVVMLENVEDVKLTQTNAPYLMSLKASGRYFSKYYGVVHPSFPNYLAFAGGDTFGNTGGGASAGAFPYDNIWNQLTGAGATWGVYEEYMPTTCYPKNSKVVFSPTKDKYSIGHNPATVFANIYTTAQCQNVRPLTAMPSVLPDLSFVTPAYCNDMHGVKNDLTYPADCQIGTQGLITRGDSWLAAHVPTWLSAGAIVIITFDEGQTKTGVGGHIYTVEVGAGISPSVNATTFNHYNLLAGLEDRFGVARLRNAAQASPLPIG
jgi:phosphatidylinositol-3-phosphatase